MERSSFKEIRSCDTSLQEKLALARNEDRKATRSSQIDENASDDMGGNDDCCFGVDESNTFQ